MNCSCTLDMHDGDFCDFEIVVDKHRHISSRFHYCAECLCEIQPNEIHEFSIAINNGDPEKYRTYHTCLELRNIFFDNWYMGSMWEDLEDGIAGGEITATEQCISSLCPENQAKVCVIVERLWEYQEDNE